MKKESVFICKKCGHNLFLSGNLKKLVNLDCPNCGEEAEELWIFSRFGNWKKEKDNFPRISK